MPHQYTIIFTVSNQVSYLCACVCVRLHLCVCVRKGARAHVRAGERESACLYEDKFNVLLGCPFRKNTSSSVLPRVVICIHTQACTHTCTHTEDQAHTNAHGHAHNHENPSEQIHICMDCDVLSHIHIRTRTFTVSLTAYMLHTHIHTYTLS